jgi:branched-subunit amino acid aminotransferase/4-amino-4-deoxychorismate lyase
MSLLWIDGHLVDKREAWVHPCDHGFLYGDGVRVGWRFHQGQAIFLKEHIEDLFAAAAEQELSIPYSRTEIHDAITETITANRRSCGYGHVIVTRGVGGFGPDPRKLDPHTLIWAEEYWPFPPELVQSGINVVFASVPHNDPRLLGNPYLVRAKKTALQHGCLDAILSNYLGELCGTTEGTLFFRQGGNWYFPSTQIPDPHARFMRDWLKQRGCPLTCCPIQHVRLFDAEEILLVSASAGVVPVVRIHETNVGDGEAGAMTRQLQEWWRTQVCRG